jgi:hypothetical protein
VQVHRQAPAQRLSQWVQCARIAFMSFDAVLRPGPSLARGASRPRGFRAWIAPPVSLRTAWRGLNPRFHGHLRSGCDRGHEECQSNRPSARQPALARLDPPGVRNLLEQDFTALEPETKWVTDIT